MTADGLQKYLFGQIQFLRKLSREKDNSNPEYQRAISDMVIKLENDREEIVRSYETLKSIGLV